jgi:hypothetical protein
MTIAPGRYRHYKGGEYVVVGAALHTETEETLVLYHAVRDGVVGEQMFARPEVMFAETVEIEGRAAPRFAPLGPDPQS